MSQTDATESIVGEYFDAYSKRDRAAIEAVIAEDLRFTSPLDNQIDRKTYFEICWPNSETIIVMALKHLQVFGQRAFVTYEALSRDGKRFRNTELLTVKEGRISEVEVYFGWNLPHTVAVGTHRADG